MILLFIHTHVLRHSLTYSVRYQIIPTLTRSPINSLTLSLTDSPTQSTHSIKPICHSFTLSLSNPVSLSGPHSLIVSSDHSPSSSLTQSISHFLNSHRLSYSVNISLTRSPIDLFSHPLIHLLGYSLIHPINHSLSHSPSGLLNDRIHNNGM